ncbi:MAG: mechanosensitive ion channel family protein [Balneolaceae bacterium]
MNSNNFQFDTLLAELSAQYGRVVETAVIIVVFIILRAILIRVINRNIKSTDARYKWRKNITYFLVFAAFILVGRTWFEGVGSLATFLGLLSAGLAIALRGPVTDMAGWIFLVWRKPFHVGDRIEISGHKGDVIDIRFFKFSILEIGNWVHADQSTGRIIHMPNNMVFSSPIANYTSDFDFVWNEIEVVITFESDWKKAKGILQDIVENHLEEFVHDAHQQIQHASKSYLIRYKNLTPIVYTEVVDIGVKLTIRHLSNARHRRGLNQVIWEDILDHFLKEPNIDFAYHTVRVYQNQLEGKKELRPDG